MIALKDSEKVRTVPSSVKNLGLKYLTNATNQLKGSIGSNVVNREALAVVHYARSLYGKLSSSELGLLQSQSLSVPALSYMALASQNSGQTGLATTYLNKIMAQAQTSGDTTFWNKQNNPLYRGFFQDTIMTNSTCMALKASMAINSKASANTGMAKYLLKTTVYGGWEDNYSTTNCVEAMEAFVSRTTVPSTASTYKLTLNGSVVRSGSFTNTSGPLAVIINKGLTGNNTLALELSGTGEVFSDISYRDTVASKPQGSISIEKETFNSAGVKSTSLKMGEIGLVKLTFHRQGTLIPLSVQDGLAAGTELYGLDSYYFYGTSGYINNLYYMQRDLLLGDATTSYYPISYPTYNNGNSVYYLVLGVTPGEYQLRPTFVRGTQLINESGSSEIMQLTVTK
jgi:hypothetical protein